MNSTTADALKAILNYLSPFKPIIRSRFEKALAAAEKLKNKSPWAKIANYHEIFGLHRDKKGWVFRPGNVRELENCIERAALLSNDGVIHGYHLPPSLQTSTYSGTIYHGTMQDALDNLERDLIMDALKTSRGNMARSAKLLGITERIMGLRVNKYQINPKRFRS